MNICIVWVACLHSTQTLFVFLIRIAPKLVYLTTGNNMLVSTKISPNLPNEPKKQIRNIFLFKFHIAFLKVLGICPIQKESLLSKIYPIVIYVVLMAVTFYSGCRRLLLSPSTSMVETALSGGGFCMLFIIFSSLFWCNISTYDRWKNLILSICKFDSTVTNSNCVSERNRFDVIRFGLMHIGPIVYIIGDYFIWETANQGIFINDIYVFFTELIAVFLEFKIATFIWEAVNVFESRYKYFNEELKRVFPKEVDEDFSRYKFDFGVQQIKFQYKMLYNGVKELNSIFYWLVLYIFCHAMFLFLTDFYWTFDVFGIKTEVVIEMVWIILGILVSCFYFYRCPVYYLCCLLFL